MGAEDGGHGASNKPHPATQNPEVPRIESPSCNRPDEFPTHLPTVVARPEQVPAEQAGYVVAGKIFFLLSSALGGLLLALVVAHMYYSARRRRLGRSLAIFDENRDDGATAPSPRGLDPAVLRALPVVPAGAGAGDCAVCLAEVEPGEKARALPRCRHTFHAECIDAWFRGNATCPLCRTDVVAPEAAEEAAQEVCIHVVVDGADDGAAAAKASGAPAMGRLPSGADLDKTRRASFASTRSVSF